MKNFNEKVKDYQKIINSNNDIGATYEALLKYLIKLKYFLQKNLSEYTFGNISPGYLDISYFPFQDEYLKKYKLRFGIILNHCFMRFELWLMAQNNTLQKGYWDLLKQSKWNINTPIMPKYGVIETILINNPNFDDLNLLTMEIKKNTINITKDIMNDLVKINK